MTGLKTITLRYCVIEPTERGCITYFEDGTSAPAHAHPEMHHSHVISHRLGYGDDVERYTLEHEACHSIVAEWFFDRPSDVLWAIAHGKMLSGHESVYEEMAAQVLQRWLRANERPIVSGVRWDDLKAYALEKLGGGTNSACDCR
jgi:hypothetical protein